jgi:hypothetical protein
MKISQHVPHEICVTWRSVINVSRQTFFLLSSLAPDAAAAAAAGFVSTHDKHVLLQWLK